MLLLNGVRVMSVRRLFLLELVVLIVIISILTSILMPSLALAREKATPQDYTIILPSAHTGMIWGYLLIACIKIVD